MLECAGYVNLLAIRVLPKKVSPQDLDKGLKSRAQCLQAGCLFHFQKEMWQASLVQSRVN